MRHIAHGIEMHQSRDRGDHNQHNRRQTVHTNGPIGRQGSALNPAQNMNAFSLAVKAEEHQPRQNCRQKQKTSSQNLRRLIADNPVTEACNQSPHQWSEKEYSFHNALPFHYVDVFNVNRAFVTEETY